MWVKRETQVTIRHRFNLLFTYFKVIFFEFFVYWDLSLLVWDRVMLQLLSLSLPNFFFLFFLTITKAALRFCFHIFNPKKYIQTAVSLTLPLLLYRKWPLIWPFLCQVLQIKFQTPTFPFLSFQFYPFYKRNRGKCDV